MKKLYNQLILLFFLFCFLTFDSFSNLITKIQKEPELDSSLQIKYQKLLKDLEDLSDLKEISLLNITSNYAQVLFHDPLEFFSEITISKGSQENIMPNSAVITNEGLIGIVKSVTNHTSKVRLLTNINTNLSVRVGDSFGILTTNSQKENWIKNLTKETKIEIGDKIYTSGLTEIPGDILIGIVEQIELDDLGLTTSIKINRTASLDNLNYVTILAKEIKE